MQRRQWIWTTIGSALSAQAWASPALPWRQRVLVGLGSTLTLRAAHQDPQRLETALDAAVAAIRRVEASMSLYHPSSEIRRLNRDGLLAQPSPELLAVLRTAHEVARRSQGQFDPTVQPLWALHARAQQEGRRATPTELAEARAQVGWQHLEIQPDRIRLHRPATAITLNGIAQGYAADQAREALRSHGIAHALMDAGEHASLGRNPQGQPWALGIEDPRQPQQLLATVLCDGRAVATSADHRSAFTPDRQLHHILDPVTGLSPQALSSVTVLAPNAMLADALTKVMFISGPTRIAALAREWQVDVLWTLKSGQWQATPGVPLRPSIT